MKKTIYNIGRDPECDICLYDTSNVTSRFHAVLKIGNDGKYYILDKSSNGTFINGVKMSSGVEVPVSRTDVISFAKACDLDWGLIPNVQKGNKKLLIIVAIAVIVLGIVGGVVYGYINSMSDKGSVESNVGEINSGTTEGNSDTPFWDNPSSVGKESDDNQDVIIESPNKKKKEEAARRKRAEKKKQEEVKNSGQGHEIKKESEVKTEEKTVKPATATATSTSTSTSTSKSNQTQLSTPPKKATDIEIEVIGEEVYKDAIY